METPELKAIFGVVKTVPLANGDFAWVTPAILVISVDLPVSEE